MANKFSSSRFCFIAPFLGYVLVSLIATWPLLFHLQGWVPGVGDWGQNMWALWWTRQALLSLAQSPFYTNYLFYPEGVTLLFHPLDVSDGLLGLPLYGVLGGDVTYNLLVLLSFALGGWGAYLLALYLTGRRGPAFVAGLIFALSPYHFLRLQLGHLNLSTLQWIPFYLLFLFKFVQQGSKRSAALAVFFLAWLAFNSWYYVIYCGLVSLAIIFWPGVTRPQETVAAGVPLKSQFSVRFGRVALVLLVTMLVLLPLLLPMLNLMSATTLVGEHNPLRHSVDVLSFWLPGPPSTWAGWFEDVWISYAAQNREPGASAYPGYVVLVLALIAVFDRRRRRQVIWWWAVALAFTVLALGPALQIDGQIYPLSLPYRLLATAIPAFGLTGIPGRMVVMTSLALAMLAAYGLSTLTCWAKNWSGVSQTTGNFWLCVAVGVLIGLEYLAAPVQLTQTRVNDFYHHMAADTGPYAVIDLKWDANFLMHAQTVHGKPLVGGWLARLPAEQAAYLNQGGLDKTFLAFLVGREWQSFTDSAQLRVALQAALQERQVRYIIDHDRAAGPWLEQWVGWPVVYEDDELVVYGP